MAKKPADQTADTTRESDVAFIRALAQLLDENDLTELQVKREYGESDRLTVRVSRRQPTLRPPLRRHRHRPPQPPPPSRRRQPNQPRPLRLPRIPQPIPAPSPRRWSAPPICSQSRAPSPS